MIQFSAFLYYFIEVQIRGLFAKRVSLLSTDWGNIFEFLDSMNYIRF